MDQAVDAGACGGDLVLQRGLLVRRSRRRRRVPAEWVRKCRVSPQKTFDGRRESTQFVLAAPHQGKVSQGSGSTQVQGGQMARGMDDGG
ncbi:MAG: hypothetical protein NTW21_14285 [Verrucomicrobia bacterium]|nr:hypothetical protein [Verrucomicrobiota bacterium]